MMRRTLGVALAALGLSMTANALAATSPVVPAGGKVVGKGYAYFLERWWLTNFAASAPPPSCGTMAVGGQTVALALGSLKPGATTTCTEPAGRAIYVVQPSNECSTLKGDHKGFGTTAADLVKCASAGLKRASYSASLDGHPINLHALLSATGVFFVPKVVGASAPTAHSAADGTGILLRGLSTGPHSLHATAVIPGAENTNYTLKLHVT